MLGESGPHSRIDERAGEIVAEVLLVRTAGSPEQTGVALFLMGGEYELHQIMASHGPAGEVPGKHRRRKQTEQGTRTGRGCQMACAGCEAVTTVGRE